MLRPDVLLEVLLASTLVGAQALVLNHLGIPFASITLFAGLGGYLVAAGSLGGAAPAVVLVAVALAFVLFYGLRRSLPDDRYLLLSLAALQVARAIAGGAKSWGGQLGTGVTWKGLPTYDAGFFLPVALAAFAGVLVLLRLLERSQLGLAVELARLSRGDERPRALVPVDGLSLLLLGLAAAIAGLVGMTGGLYAGRVSPDAFGLNLAISTLVATLVAGRRAWTVGIVSLAFFAFPHLFSSLLGYQVEAMGHLREILWSAAVLFWGPRLMAVGSRFRLHEGAR